MGRFAKHIGIGEEIEIECEKYLLKPLDIEAMPDFLLAMKAFAGAKDGEGFDKIAERLNTESIQSLKNLILSTLKISFPEDWKTDPSELKSFGMKYMMVLLPKIIEINSAQDNTHETNKKDILVARLKKDAESTSTETPTFT